MTPKLTTLRKVIDMLHFEKFRNTVVLANISRYNQKLGLKKTTVWPVLYLFSPNRQDQEWIVFNLLLKRQIVYSNFCVYNIYCWIHNSRCDTFFSPFSPSLNLFNPISWRIPFICLSLMIFKNDASYVAFLKLPHSVPRNCFAGKRIMISIGSDCPAQSVYSE